MTNDRNIGFAGGAELQQSILAKSLAALGHQVSMVCLDYGQPDGLEVAGVTVYKAFRPYAGLPGFRFFHPRLTGVWQAMRRAGADIYYQRTAAMLTGVVAEFCRRYNRKSVYAGAHDSDFMPGRQYIRLRRDRWLFERGLRSVDAVLVQNPTQRALCLANYGRSARLLRNCYAPPPTASRDETGPILWVSTLRPFKRPELLLRLAAALPDLRFRMIGGPGGDRAADLAYYRRMQAQAGALPNVEFLGWVPFADVERHFDSAGLFVNTSVQEGFPNTFLQAWARGIPTVSFIDPALPGGASPICTVVRDVPEAVRVIRSLTAPATDHRRSLGEHCRRYYLARHTPAAVVPAFERFLFSLVTGRRD
jgi:glycosyltransferase involved in cell wall biosynthesis